MNRRPLIRYFSINQIPTQQKLLELRAIEDVTMVGYPIGLWDTANNLPIVRRGITASHPALDFDGFSEGMIDIACFGGSSGSPIVILNEGTYTNKAGTLVLGSRAYFIGVLYAGPADRQEGFISKKKIPTKVTSVPVLDLMVHLGWYIKAKELEVIGDIIRRSSCAFASSEPI